MKWDNALIPTLKESPREAEVISHKLMIRAGMIRKVASGIYSFLPLGLRVMRKFEAIVREEMDACGGQEVLLPSIIPAELWKKSGRWEAYGKELLRLKDRMDREFCYGPTHEEVILDLVSPILSSYKQLPLLLYQIQTKFRDEIRPRFGIMRGREFGMKDAYSFHNSDTDLNIMYKKIETAYQKIFSRCGLDIKQVNADSGLIGGSESAEYMVVSQTGEDIILSCDHCNTATNIEAAQTLKAGDSCHHCQPGTLQEVRGIEVGHIFKLGQKYSEAMNSVFVGEDGKTNPYVMGCYGIGIGRTIAAAIEQSHDDKGIIWPLALAPFQVVITLVNIKLEDHKRTGEALYETLKKQGIEVLLDNRTVSAGVKFKDAELIGIPYQVIIGKTFSEQEKIEIKNRATAQTDLLPIQQVTEHIKKAIQNP